MSIEIKNLTSRPVLMRLNSGKLRKMRSSVEYQSLHLAPGETSAEVLDSEVSNNPKVTKLQGRHIISLIDVKTKVQKPASVGAKPKKTK